MPPSVWLCIVLALGIPATYGTMWVKQQFAVQAAYKEGMKAGQASAAAEVTAHAQETISALASGKASAPSVPRNRARLVALCKRSASCRDRNRLKRRGR